VCCCSWAIHCFKANPLPLSFAVAVAEPGRYGAKCEKECTAGFYCPGGAAALIISCGIGRTSSAGAASEADCRCIAGRHYNISHAHLVRRQLAMLCRKQQATAAMLMAAATPVLLHQCFALFTCCAVPAGYGGSECKLCELGTYSEGNSLGPCMPCPGDTTTLVAGATSEDSCVCRKGYGQDTLNDPCEVCPANTWSNPSPASRSCQDCPDNFVSPAESTSINQCGKPAQLSDLSCSLQLAVISAYWHRLLWLCMRCSVAAHQLGAPIHRCLPCVT
jgi:hypothetical protein